MDCIIWWDLNPKFIFEIAENDLKDGLKGNTCNGLTWNGNALNGLTWNGNTLNGQTWNGGARKNSKRFKNGDAHKNNKWLKKGGANRNRRFKNGAGKNNKLLRNGLFKNGARRNALRNLKGNGKGGKGGIKKSINLTDPNYSVRNGFGYSRREGRYTSRRNWFSIKRPKDMTYSRET